MIRRALKLGVSLVILLIVAYFSFMVPLGRYTLYEHIVRIAATEEAQEFGGDVRNASQELTDRVGEEIRERLDGGTTDAL